VGWSGLAAGLLSIAVGYASGAVPWGFVLGRLATGTDLRRHGSGSTGATNALRVLGWRISLAVFALDFAKGYLPVLLAGLVGLNGWWQAAVGIASVAGHCWSPVLGFHGGKGMATGAGAAAAVFPWVLLVGPLMALIVAVTRYVSLASIVGSLAVTAVVVALGIAGSVTWSVALLIAAVTAIILFQHQGNIRRLLAGTERRFGEAARG
jgi:glycerol-3-phosphate acyltransferase PlsY